MGQVALEAGALHRVGAAVHPLQDPALDQLPQVAPYGLLGDGQVQGERPDLHAAVGAGTDEDLALALVRLQPPRLPSFAGLSCDAGHAVSLHEGTVNDEPEWAG